MVKVRTSQIPEENGKPNFTKNKVKKQDDTWLDTDNDFSFDARYNDSDDEEERYLRSMISFPEEGINMSLFGIETIEKVFNVKESNYGGENVSVQYGIAINKGMEPSMRYPRVDINIWFDSEEVRDQRYNNMLAKLKKAGFRFIEV